MRPDDDFLTDDFSSQDDLDQELFEHFRIRVDKGQDLLRIDKFLMNRIENTSRSRIQAAAEAGNILVNGKTVKSNYRVKPADLISVVFAHPPRDTEIIPQNIPFKIEYEDDTVVVINKHAGLVVHPGHGNYSGTLVNGLMYHFQHLPLYSKNQPRPGLVHRLDKDTSGIMIVAKNEFALSHLARQFFERTTERKYVALVWGDFKTENGVITGNLARDKRDRKMMAVCTDETEGKHAVTHYKVIKRFGYLTFIECRLETGRTHQIRAHMKYIGHPLFNDSLYGGNKILKGLNTQKYRQFIENCFEIMPRQALHAKSLGFIHPLTGKKMFFDSEMPDDFSNLLSKLGQYINPECGS